ncbi:MAG: transporter [Marmoricola sp.]|nr:transporter [Marmoricola sp.]
MSRTQVAPPAAPPRHVVPLLAAFASLVVLTTDVYLPVLPQLASDLSTSAAAASATVSCVLVGIAVGQVVIGPLSDAVGRRAPLLLGAAAYALLHVLSALSPSIAVLLGVRVLAGFATAACIVVGRAVVVDLFPGEGTTRAFAVLGAVTSIVPVLAPVVGSLLALVTGWRGMFLVLAALAVLLVAVGSRALPESLPAERRVPAHLGAVLRELGAVLRLRPFLAHAAAIGAVGVVLFGYIGASSFTLQGTFGLSPQQYGLVFALNSVGIFAASNLAARLAGRVPPGRLLTGGQSLCAGGVTVLALGVAAHVLVVVCAGLFLTISSIGLVMPSAMALGMAASGGRAGAAAGVFGIVQFACGAAASPLAGAGGSPWSLVVVLAVGALASPLLLHLLRGAAPQPSAPGVRREGDQP